MCGSGSGPLVVVDTKNLDGDLEGKYLVLNAEIGLVCVAIVVCGGHEQRP